jgi:hypothetical protein
MSLEIFPYEGVGSIKLGMSQTEVRNAVGSEFKPFMKTPISEMPTDNFVGKGIHVYYKSPGICKAIELHPPSNPTFRGYRLINLPFGQLAAYFKQEDPLTKIDDYGLTSTIFGVNLFVPDLDDGPESPVKAVLVFERGYYG